MPNKEFRLAERIDAIEDAYEFMLAYAAQGKQGSEGGACDEVRGFLKRAIDALEGFAGGCRAAIDCDDAAAEALEAFLVIVESDVEKARAALRLALAQPLIGSQLIDNLNASIHLRTLLTDLFLLDSVVPQLNGTGDAAAVVAAQQAGLAGLA